MEYLIIGFLAFWGAALGALSFAAFLSFVLWLITPRRRRGF